MISLKRVNTLLFSGEWFKCEEKMNHKFFMTKGFLIFMI